MKKIILSAMVFGALMSARLTAAEGTSSHPDNPAKSTVVSFNEVSAGDVLYIKDSDGVSIYSKEIKTDGSYTGRFNLSNLPENQYYFEVEKADAITILPFNIESENITLHKDLRTEVVKPQLVALKDQVFLERDVEDAQSLEVDIYYKGHNLVYSEKIDRVGKLVRKYDFSNSRHGEYLFHIKYDDRILTEYVSVL